MLTGEELVNREVIIIQEPSASYKSKTFVGKMV